MERNHPISMNSNGQSESVDSADGSSDSGSDMVRMKTPLEPPTVESKYLTPLWVSSKEEPPEQFLPSDSPQLVGFELPAEDFNRQITEEIRAALKILSFRELRVLIQFWSPQVIGNRLQLTTADQPFGLGASDDEGIQSYRKHSVDNPVVVVKDLEERDHGPVARVFRRGLPVWTFDITNYSSRDFPQRECAIRCNFRGYMALPVFDSSAGLLCVGVLELLTSSKYNSFAFEVQQVHRALKTVYLKSPQAFDFHPSEDFSKRKQSELDKIFSILKIVCEVHRLPLAQTWAMSPLGSYVSHEKVLKKSCSSFDTKCIVKVCMYTNGLPFYVQDLSKWDFRKACKEQHLEKSKGVAGSAMLSHSSCFCGDVTKLSKDEYPLVYDADMNRLTSCFAIFLRSVEAGNDYVLEFFLPLDIKDSVQVRNLVHTLKHNFNVASGFKLGDTSTVQEVGLPLDLSVYREPNTTQASNCVADNFLFGPMDSAYSETLVADIARNGSVYVEDQLSPSNRSIEESHVTCIGIDGNSNPLQLSRKRKRDLDTTMVPMEVKVEVTFNEYTKKFLFPISLGLSNLKNIVAERFKLQGNGLILKYTDEDNDLISILCDDDLKLALGSLASNNSINLICIRG